MSGFPGLLHCHGCFALALRGSGFQSAWLLGASRCTTSRIKPSKPSAIPSSWLTRRPELGIKKMKIEEKSSIRCGTHGTRTPAIVCCHMTQAKDLVVGFVENSSDPDDLQAWCAACEHLYLEEGDKTERFKAFNDFKVVCDFCYASLKERHSDTV